MADFLRCLASWILCDFVDTTGSPVDGVAILRPVASSCAFAHCRRHFGTSDSLLLAVPSVPRAVPTELGEGLKKYPTPCLCCSVLPVLVLVLLGLSSVRYLLLDVQAETEENAYGVTQLPIESTERFSPQSASAFSHRKTGLRIDFSTGGRGATRRFFFHRWTRCVLATRSP